MYLAVGVALGIALGCSDDDAASHRKKPSPQSGKVEPKDGGSDARVQAGAAGGDAGPNGGGTNGSGGSSSLSAGSGGSGAPAQQPQPEFGIPMGVCKRGGLCQTLNVGGSTKADLLFVIDNSNSSGCGFEQPLEAALKALWPSLDPLPNPDGSNRIVFLGDHAAHASQMSSNGTTSMLATSGSFSSWGTS